MGFNNNFNDKKSSFYFKDTLYSSTLNTYLKESSLINYSLIELLKDYYVGNLREISIHTTDNNVINFIKISLENFLFKYVSNKIIFDFTSTYLKVNNQYNAIRTQFYTTEYNEQNRSHKDIYNYYDLITDDTMSISSEKKITHNDYLSNEESTVGSNVSKEAWGQTFTIPSLKTEKGHIKGVWNRQIFIPNPHDEIVKVWDQGAPFSYIYLRNQYNNDLLLVLRIQVSGQAWYTGVVTKYVSFDRLYYSSNHTILFDFYMEEGSGVQYTMCLPLTLSFDSANNTIIGSFDQNFNGKPVDFPLGIYTLTIYSIKHKS